MVRSPERDRRDLYRVYTEEEYLALPAALTGSESERTIGPPARAGIFASVGVVGGLLVAAAFMVTALNGGHRALASSATASAVSRAKSVARLAHQTRRATPRRRRARGLASVGRDGVDRTTITPVHPVAAHPSPVLEFEFER
jgi:hypothetical protein